MTRGDKTFLFDELLSALTQERDTVVGAQRATAEGATHEQSKADSDKDTRAIEASYLARGQAERAANLREDVERVRNMSLRDFSEDSPIAIGALVTLLMEDGQDKCVFIAPAGGGLALDEGRVHVVTPASPLGRALVGATMGDAVDVRRGGKTQLVDIEAVR